MRSAWKRERLAALLPLLVALLSLPIPSSARADDCHPKNGLSPCIDADNLWPHAGGGAFFSIGDTATTPAGKLSLGIVGSYLAQPIGVRVATADPAGSSVFLVDGAFDATLLLALGVTDWFELTLAAPATLYQSGAGLALVDGTAAPPLRFMVRDLRFGFSIDILRRPPADASAPPHGPALTGRLEFGVPTALSGNFAGGATMVAVPSLAFSYRLGRVDLAAELSARVRGEAAFANAVVGTQIGAALGASVDILRDRWLSAGVEAFALPTTSKQLPDPATGASSALVPAEWIAHASTAHFLGGELVLILGGGTSLPFTPHSALTSPRYRLDFAIRLAPTGRGRPRPPPEPPGAHDPR